MLVVGLSGDDWNVSDDRWASRRLYSGQKHRRLPMTGSK